jgi:hypothetical protein
LGSRATISCKLFWRHKYSNETNLLFQLYDKTNRVTLAGESLFQRQIDGKMKEESAGASAN